jgi:hypothetical protein
MQNKNYKTHLRSNNYEACRAVASCFPNILDLLTIENGLSSDEIERPSLWSNEKDLDFCHQSSYIRWQQCIYISTSR